MTREARSIRCPETVLGWIPWYGETDERGERLLDARQRGAIEAHASECPECRAELDMISGAPYEIDVELPDPERVFEAISARIDAGEAEGVDTAPEPPARRLDAARRLSMAELSQIADWVFDEHSELELVRPPAPAAEVPGRVVQGPWTRPAVWVAAAAAAFLLGLFGGRALDGAMLSSAPDATVYTTAAAGGETGAGLIDVVFVETVTVAELASDLRALGVEIVSGPSGVGRYRLRVSDAGGSGVAPADVAAIAARLKAGASPLALYAEPVRAEPVRAEPVALGDSGGGGSDAP